MKSQGILVVSLDLEMRWGVLATYRDTDQYSKNIFGVESAVKGILNSFETHKIHATWAFVGAMLCENYEEFSSMLPKNMPNFDSKVCSSYNYLNYISNNETQFFNPDLVKKIAESKGQEIASHTFSHLYVKEKGVTYSDFLGDLKIFYKLIKEKLNMQAVSFVYPRNQVQYTEALRCFDFKCYRGTGRYWFNKNDNLLSRIVRLFVMHFGPSKLGSCNISINSKIINVPGTIFLRPYDNYFFQKLRIWRIKRTLLYAKNHSMMVHIWWHPHNFGVNLNKNLIMLDEILLYSNKIELLSLNMNEASSSV
jgi:peptidoglycan/xylan/chitin deacetylase (PgdA/CDA1 family)